MNGLAVVNREEILRYFPHLTRTHQDTVFQVYREHKVDRGVIELIIFFREPGESKIRIDAEWIMDPWSEDLKLDATEIKITYWGDATRAVA